MFLGFPMDSARSEWHVQISIGAERYLSYVLARGIKFGSKPKLTKHQREEALARKRNGETLTEIAKSYNVSHMTIGRL